MQNNPDPQPPVSRRQFLKILAIGGAALTAGLGLGFENDILKVGQAGVIRESHLLMGTAVNLTLASDDPVKAKRACDECVKEMRRRVNVFNRFDPQSQLSKLNSEGRLRNPDRLLLGILEDSARISQASGGAFDVSIKPLLDLYLASQIPGGCVPDYEDIRLALKRVDYGKIVCDEREIGLAAPGMSLTLDGIAKGAVIDAGVEVLRMWGFEDVIVEAGGDLLAAGERGLDRPWKVGIRPPREGMSRLPPVLHIKDRAVATSGDYLQAFKEDYSIHHILDPRRGISCGEISSATVVAPSAILADGLATAIMVLGCREGLELVKRFPECEGYLVDKEQQAAWSAGMQSYFSAAGMEGRS